MAAFQRCIFVLLPILPLRPRHDYPEEGESIALGYLMRAFPVSLSRLLPHDHPPSAASCYIQHGQKIKTGWTLVHAP